MDNPTYDENIIINRPLETSQRQQNTNDEGPRNPHQGHSYQTLSKDTMMRPNIYHVLEKPTTATNGQEVHSSMEATYAVPEDAMDTAQGDDNCYSVLGPADYSILEPHLSGAELHQQHEPVVDAEYSRLQHIWVATHYNNIATMHKQNSYH